MKKDRDKKFNLTITESYSDKMGKNQIVNDYPQKIRRFFNSINKKVFPTIKCFFVSYVGFLLKRAKREKILLDILEHGQSGLKEKAIKKLNGLNPFWRQNLNAHEFLQKLLTDLKNVTKGPNAAIVLGLIGDDKAVDPLIRVLENGYEQTKIPSAKALGLIGDKRAIYSLIKVLNDPNETLRKNAVISMGMIGDSLSVLFYPPWKMKPSGKMR